MICVLDWDNIESLKSFAKEMAKHIRNREGRVRRLFSELSTCSSSHEAEVVVAFHIVKLAKMGDERLKRDLEILFDSIPSDVEKFRYKFLPKIKFFYIYLMYYSKFIR